jgi:hypothetical protein
VALPLGRLAATSPRGALWISTTQKAPWQSLNGVAIGPLSAELFARDVEIRVDKPQQVH